MQDDAAGRRAAAKYRDEWFLGNDSVRTLGELDPRCASKKLETLLSGATRAEIARELGNSGQPSKKEIGLFLAERCAVPQMPLTLSTETEQNMHRVLAAALAILTA